MWLIQYRGYPDVRKKESITERDAFSYIGLFNSTEDHVGAPASLLSKCCCRDVAVYIAIKGIIRCEIQQQFYD